MRNFNENYSLVRGLHAVVGGDTVDIYLNGNPFFYNIKFTDFTPYVYVPEGKYTVEVFPRDQKENPIVTGTVEVSPGELITIVPNGRPVDILLDKEMVLEDVEYKEVTPYTDVDPKTYQVDVLLNENGQLIRQIRVTINPGRVYSFYGLGNKPNFQIFQSLDGATFMI